MPHISYFYLKFILFKVGTCKKFCRELRYVAHRQIIRWCWGYLGKHSFEENIYNTYTCMCHGKIRQTFPAHDGQYQNYISNQKKQKKKQLELTFCNRILMNSKDFTRSFVIYKDLSIVSGNKSLHSSSFILLICIATEQVRNYSVYRNGVVLVIQHIRSLQLLFHQNLCIS